MDLINLSQANQAVIIRQQQAASQPVIADNPEAPKEKKNGKKLLIAGAVITAAIAIAGIAICRGKNTTKLKDIKFNNGVAKKGDKLFTGVVKDTLNNGDKVTLEYVDGVIKKSKVEGGKAFEKVFETNEAGHKIVKTIKGGAQTVVDVTQKQNDVKFDQEKIDKLLKSTNLSSKELVRQSDEIKFKSVKQQEEINKFIDDKKVLEEKAAREAQEKAAREAQEKALIEFEKSLESMSDEELDKIFDEIVEKTKTQDSDLLRNKLSAIGKQQRLRRYDNLEKLLHEPADKRIETMHVSKYATEAEMFEITNYYDDFQCNDAYRYAAKMTKEEMMKNFSLGGPFINVDEEIMDGVFKKAPALESEAVVYRAVHSAIKTNQQFIDSFRDGFIIDNPGYTSTSTIVKDAQFYQFAGGVADKSVDGVLMRIHLPKGTKGILGGRNEYLLPRNSKIKVNKIEVIDGVKVANCEYILPKS